MKKTLIAFGIAAVFVGTQVQTANARDCNFSPIGPAVGGFMAGAILVGALQPHSVYVSAPAPVYCPPPTRIVYAPTPIRVVCAPSPMAYHERYGWVGYGHHHGRFGQPFRGGYYR